MNHKRQCVWASLCAYVASVEQHHCSLMKSETLLTCHDVAKPLKKR